MDPVPLCAWCGLGFRDVLGAKFNRHVVVSKDGSQRVSYGLHYREDGSLSCVDEDPLVPELDSGRITGELLKQIADRGAGRLLIRQAKEVKRLRPIPAPSSPRRGSRPSERRP